MERTIRRNTNWLRKFAWHRRDSADNISLDHGLYPENYFREKLLQERMRAQRSKKAIVLMIVDAEEICSPDRTDDVMESVGEELTFCVRDTDICGRLREGGLIGVILTEIEPERLEAAQQTVARKTREKLAALLDEELAGRIAITFHVLNPAADGSGFPDLTLSPALLQRAPAPGRDRLTLAGVPEDEGDSPEGYQGGARSG